MVGVKAMEDPEVLSMGLLGLDTNRAPNWPGLRTLLQLLPPQDSDVGAILPGPWGEELAELRLFCVQRRREALGLGVACLMPPKLEECTCEKKELASETLVRKGAGSARGQGNTECLQPGQEPRCWHQACCACQACGQALINRIYCYRDGHLYCGRYRAEP
ncbi:hypothetical protein QTO34_001537 [Cnephaeus nilssonii]|uniref:Uncharacterized protein n=1 Tax=Cnephaeus nilssonii TaxID=3371016 RepID=A0AA40HWV1_CNENI|nr:hypothetical protein QTO34_001537 [Eptesicus nilssonii]